METKKNLPVIILFIIVVILGTLFALYLPAINRGVRMNNYQKQLKQEKEQWAKCETIMSGSHRKAEELRAKIAKEMGLIQPEATGQTTPSQEMNKLLSGDINTL